MMLLPVAAILVGTLSSASAFAPSRLPTRQHHQHQRAFSASSHRLLGVSKDTLDGAQAMIDAIIDEKNCNPFFVRLAWHDSGTYDANIKEDWPAAGGAIGSIRFAPEITHGANNGLINAVKLLEPVKKKFSEMSYADIYQMASARGIEKAGGPKIDMK